MFPRTTILVWVRSLFLGLFDSQFQSLITPTTVTTCSDAKGPSSCETITGSCIYCMFKKFCPFYYNIYLLLKSNKTSWAYSSADLENKQI